MLVADMIYSLDQPIDPRNTIVDSKEHSRTKSLNANSNFADLLQPVMRAGNVTAPVESLSTIRDRVQSQLKRLHPSSQRLLNPHEYPVGIEIGLAERRETMIRDSHR